MFSFFGLAREVCRRPLSALLTCALLLSSLGIYIIPHLIEFVKGFLKNICKYFSSAIAVALLYNTRSVLWVAVCLAFLSPRCTFADKKVSVCLSIPRGLSLLPLDNNIISHLQEIVNSQNHQSFVREFVQSAYYTQNGARRPCALRPRVLGKNKKD